MAKYEVDKDLIIHVKVKVTVEADSADDALDKAAEQFPHNYDPGTQKGWKATVDVKPPKGVDMRVVRAYHFEQASGADKARKIG